MGRLPKQRSASGRWNTQMTFTKQLSLKNSGPQINYSCYWLTAVWRCVIWPVSNDHNIHLWISLLRLGSWRIWYWTNMLDK